MTAKQLEQETGCKIMVRGKGSMRDKKKVSLCLTIETSDNEICHRPVGLRQVPRIGPVVYTTGSINL